MERLAQMTHQSSGEFARSVSDQIAALEDEGFSTDALKIRRMTTSTKTFTRFREAGLEALQEQGYEDVEAGRLPHLGYENFYIPSL